jgi:uncharacterized metal-binding protein
MDSKAKNDSGCGCSPAPKAIYACSGASDVGEISDRAARKLTREGLGNMACIAGIGGHVGASLDVANVADAILVIDGCSQNCAKKTMEHAGYHDFLYIGVYDLGLPKGKSPATDENIERVAQKGKELLS